MRLIWSGQLPALRCFATFERSSRSDWAACLELAQSDCACPSATRRPRVPAGDRAKKYAKHALAAKACTERDAVASSAYEPTGADQLIPRQQKGNLQPSTESTPNSAGDLRPAYPVAVAHRNFGVTQALQSGLDLHLHGPAIVQIRHPQPAQAATSNGAKRAEVRRSQAISLAQPFCGDPVSSALLNGQRSRLRLALRTRSHDQVGDPGLDGLKKALQVPKIVAAIRVKKNYYLAIQGKCSQSCQARGAVSPPRFPNDRGSRTPRVRGSFINAAVVNHVNIPHWRPRNRLNHGSYGLGLVQRRNDHVDVQGLLASKRAKGLSPLDWDTVDRRAGYTTVRERVHVRTSAQSRISSLLRRASSSSRLCCQ